MAFDPKHDDLDSCDARSEESITTEIGEIELIDPDAPPTLAGMMRQPDEPPAPDPVEITKRLASADVDGLVSDAEPVGGRTVRSLAERMAFEGLKRPEPKHPPEPEVRPRSFLARLFGKLFGRRG